MRTSTSIFEDDRISTHADPTSTRCMIFHERRISSVNFTSAHVYAGVYIAVGVSRALADSSDFGLLGEQSFSANGRFPAHHAKFDATSFISGREIRHRTNTQNYKRTNKQ